jgi:type IV fimbrial biogenesis protein FimT
MNTDLRSLGRRGGQQPGRQAGLSLVEMAATMAVLGVLAGAVLPQHTQMHRHQRLQGVAAQVEADLQFARSSAERRQQAVRFTLGEATQGSCYLVHTGAADACRCDNALQARCEPGAVLLRSVARPEVQGVHVRSAVRSIVFDPALGTSTPTATLRVAQEGPGAEGLALHKVVNVVGRVRTCVSGGSFHRYPVC